VVGIGEDTSLSPIPVEAAKPAGVWFPPNPGCILRALSLLRKAQVIWPQISSDADPQIGPCVHGYREGALGSVGSVL
jgi:hypothetical protein